jgi:predicted S18 family serine protease
MIHGKKFEAKVSKMGNKRIINVPAKITNFTTGSTVTVKELIEKEVKK